MSKKSKLILATAVFGAALFGASCGGGGGTTAGTGTGNGSGSGNGSGGNGSAPPPPPPASIEGRVLALLEVNASKRVSICELKNDTQVECGDDISSGANTTLSYIHEFSNGNVLLRDSNNKLYFFDGNQVKKLTTYKGLGSADETTTSAGIDALTGSGVEWHATPNFVIMYGGSNLVAVSKEGKVIRDSGVTVTPAKIACEAVRKGTKDYKLKTDGSSSITTIPTVQASAGGKYVVNDEKDIYLTSNKCSIEGAVYVNTLNSDPDDAKMVLAGDGNFYIAVRHSTTNLKYYKVSGNTASEITLSPNPTLYNPGSGDNPKYSYALDGEGRLYAINGSSTYPVLVYSTAGAELGRHDVAPTANYTKLLGFKDRVLARDNRTASDVHEIRYNGSQVVNNTITSYISLTLLTACTDTTNTKANDGMGTNFNRCAANTGLYSLKYDKDDNRYYNATYSVSISSPDNVKWDTSKALVYSGSTVFLCSTTESPTVGISCNDIGAPTLDTTLLREGDTVKYLKSDGKDKVLYTSGSTAKVGELLGPPDKVQYLLTTNISGGSASFDLTKFAYIAGSGSCLTSIAYLSSPTGFPKAYTIEQPSGACLKGILKVY
jgi:hypothetical protein